MMDGLANKMYAFASIINTNAEIKNEKQINIIMSKSGHMKMHGERSKINCKIH